MCVIISIQDGGISLSNSVEMMSSLQDLFFIDIISFWTPSIVRGAEHLNCGMPLICGLNSSKLANSSLDFFLYFSLKNSAKSLAISSSHLFSGNGFDGFVVLYYWLQRIAVLSHLYSPLSSW